MRPVTVLWSEVSLSAAPSPPPRKLPVALPCKRSAGDLPLLPQAPALPRQPPGIVKESKGSCLENILAARRKLEERQRAIIGLQR